MDHLETSMGGSREAFPDTAGFSAFADPALTPAERQARMGTVIPRYWRPVYAYIRVFQGARIEDAKDLTQDFFRYLLEAEVVAAYEPGRGRFRHFLKGTLRNFLSKARRTEGAEKRGGGRPILSLDGEELKLEPLVADRRAEGPDRLFDRQWAEDVVAQGVARLRDLLRSEGKERYFQVYEAQDLCPDGAERPSYEETAGAVGISTGDVRNYLHHARSLLEQLIVRIVREYAGSREELKDELRDLFSG